MPAVNVRFASDCGKWIVTRFPDRGESIALCCPCFAQALGPSVATRRTHAFDPWTPREKLSALLRSCNAQKAGGMPSMANPARRMRRALRFHAPSGDLESPLSATFVSFMAGGFTGGLLPRKALWGHTSRGETNARG